MKSESIITKLSKIVKTDEFWWVIIIILTATLFFMIGQISSFEKEPIRIEKPKTSSIIYLLT